MSTWGTEKPGWEVRRVLKGPADERMGCSGVWPAGTWGMDRRGWQAHGVWTGAVGKHMGALRGAAGKHTGVPEVPVAKCRG